MTRSQETAVAAALVALFTAACGTSDVPRATEAGTPASAASEPSGAAAIGPTGRIRGVVKLTGTPPPARMESVGQNQDVCGQAVPATRLQVGAAGGVRQAFIYLENVPSTAVARPRATLEVGQRGCVYTPHAMVFPTSAALEIVNDDPILHNVHAREMAPEGPRTVFNIAQPMRGQRTRLDKPFARTGVLTLTCEAGHPWMSAHVLVADHPYVAVSDEEGAFTIENVPAGTYPITMWHEGVRLTRVVTSLQQYEYEPPYQTTEQVVVPPGGDALVTFALQLR